MIEAEHSPIAPSSADIWVNCPGSVAMQAAQPPEEETEESREGTAAHWLLEQILLKLPVPADAIAPNGVPINDEMRAAVRELVDDVIATTSQIKPGDYFQVEQKIAAPTMIHPDFFGTPDVYTVLWSRKTVQIHDFKYGHLFVDVYRCLQLIGYAAMVIETEQIPDWREWAFTFTIAQPRCYARDELGGTLREWFTSGEKLAPLFDEMRLAALAARTPGAPCKTGDHCTHCRAAWDCEANQRAGGVALSIATGQQFSGMDAHALGLEARTLARAADFIKARLSSVDAKIQELINQKTDVPWHTVGYSKPRLVWDKKKQAEAAQMVAMFGVPVVPGVAIPTPTDCMKQGVDETVISPYTTKAPAAQKLIRVEDNRAEKIFGRRD
jgi:Protein of unknown function (DUF2800).